ncbi:MAG: CapA family protein [Pirellulaceae bacterium]
MNAVTIRPPLIRLAAVGDLLIAPPPSGISYPRSVELVAPALRDFFQNCDIVFGNLECALSGDGTQIPTEPRVVATPELVRAVKSVGFHVVTLANNHAFDCLESGFENLRRLLDGIGLPHFGAGMNLEEAVGPAILEVNGLRLAFIGAVDERSGATQFAAAGQAGVALLDVDRLVAQIRDLRKRVDHVIVSLHWGEERFLVPSPVQIDQARALATAGASMVIGHHPHVLQGLEIYRNVPIIYSLGNFIADEVFFTDGHINRWNRTGRTGCILMAELSKEGVHNVRQIPTYDPGQAVELDDSRFGPRRIAKTCRALEHGVTFSRYRREHLWVKTIKPALEYLHWRRIKNLRPRHFQKAVAQVVRSRVAK